MVDVPYDLISVSGDGQEVETIASFPVESFVISSGGIGAMASVEADLPFPFIKEKALQGKKRPDHVFAHALGLSLCPGFDPAVNREPRMAPAEDRVPGIPVKATVDSRIRMKVNFLYNQPTFTAFNDIQQHYFQDQDFHKLVMSFNIASLVLLTVLLSYGRTPIQG